MPRAPRNLKLWFLTLRHRQPHRRSVFDRICAGDRRRYGGALEYLWLYGYKPVPNLRGKTQIKEYTNFPTLDQLPLWGFDGSSTKPAEGRSSDCVLKPVSIFFDTTRKNGVLVMCVMMPDGVTPHPTNARATILDDPGAWFGFEQEYFFYKSGRPLGFPESGYPAPQGPYYTGVGSLVMLPARLSRSISTSVWTPASIMKASPPKWPKANGSSRSSVRLQESRRRNVGRALHSATLGGKIWHRHRVIIANRSEIPIGTAPACTPISPPLTCARGRQGLLRKIDDRL